jgi:drug/metabolite transporter (DMT)-like permease
MSTPRGKAILAVVLATLAWGTTGVFIRFFSHPGRFAAFADAPRMDPFTQTLGRYGVALGVLLILGLFRRRMRIDRLKGRWWLLMLVPAVPNIAMQVFWVSAYYYAKPIMVSLLAKLAVLLSLTFTYIFFRDERRLIGNWRLLGAALLGVGAAVGVVLAAAPAGPSPAATHSAADGADLVVGALLVVGSSTCWALYSVGVKFVMRREPIPSGGAFVIAAVYMVAAFAVMTAIWGRYGLFARAGWPVLGLLVLSGTLNIAIPHVLYYYSIRHLGVAVTALVTMCTTFVTAALSIPIFQEVLTVGQLGFGAMLMGSAATAVWLSRRRIRPPREPSMPEPPIE